MEDSSFGLRDVGVLGEGRWEAGRARSGLTPTTVLATNIGKERDLELLASFHNVNHKLEQTHRSITVVCRHSNLTSSIVPV